MITSVMSSLHLWGLIKALLSNVKREMWFSGCFASTQMNFGVSTPSTASQKFQIELRIILSDIESSLFIVVLGVYIFIHLVNRFFDLIVFNLQLQIFMSDFHFMQYKFFITFFVFIFNHLRHPL